MNFLLKAPGIRILKRVCDYIHKPAPLNEFYNYDEYWKNRVSDELTGRYLDRFSIITKLIGDGESVLDIGCGDCSFQEYLAKTKPKCKSLGLDTSTQAVELAKTRNINAKLIDNQRSLAQQVDSNWNVVTLMEVIEHLPDAENLVRQVIELSPSKIFITIPNISCMKHRLRLLFGSRFPITCIYYHMKEHVRFWTVKDFKEWSETLGLSVQAVHGQFDHGDSIVEWFVRKFPAMFADRVVYQLVIKQKTSTKHN